MRVQRCLMIVAVLATCMGSAAQPSPSGASSHRSKSQYDGTWWLAANPGETSGFINGVADCMTWEAHKQGYSATPEQLGDKITAFYKANPGSKSATVLEAWQRVSSSPKQVPVPKGGEAWNNPHWYLNGDWWAQSGQTEQIGFLEGYLWCMGTQVEEPHPRYSKPASFYWEKSTPSSLRIRRWPTRLLRRRLHGSRTPARGASIHPYRPARAARMVASSRKPVTIAVSPAIQKFRGNEAEMTALPTIAPL
jgi:hypothetical protein